MTTPQQQAKTPIWLDCDPGHDDVFAILLAAAHDDFDLLGLSTVHGNAPMSHVTTNALSVLTAFGASHIPVHPGAAAPFLRPAIHAPAIHGASGIDGTALLPAPAAAASGKNAIVAMRDALMATAAGTAVLVATGTLTNVALLLRVFPEVAGHIRHLAIMGGAFASRPDCRGNIVPHAEFNVFCDPESAQAVLSTAALDGKVTLVPLDITHTVLADAGVRARLLGDGKPLRRMLVELLMFFAETYARAFGNDAGPPVHDPLAVAAVLGGGEGGGLGWEWEEGVRVRVVCEGEEVGKTEKVEGGAEVRKAGLGGRGEEEVCRVRIAKSIDVEKFWSLIAEMVEKVDGRYVWPENA